MTTSHIPHGYQTITPYLAVKGARAFLDFLRTAFGAEELDVSTGEGGMIYNAEVRLGTSMLMVADSRAEKPNPATLYLYVSDPDELYERVLAAGAKSIMPMTDQFYGDRSGGVQDSWGNQWWIAKRVKNVSPEEIASFKDKQSK